MSGTYEGEWKANHRHGKGKFKDCRGAVFEVSSASFVSVCVSVCGNSEGFLGRKYLFILCMQGTWNRDKRDGEGILTTADGSQMKVVYKVPSFGCISIASL
jgi:hypothetical protein